MPAFFSLIGAIRIKKRIYIIIYLQCVVRVGITRLRQVYENCRVIILPKIKTFNGAYPFTYFATRHTICVSRVSLICQFALSTLRFHTATNGPSMSVCIYINVYYKISISRARQYKLPTIMRYLQRSQFSRRTALTTLKLQCITRLIFFYSQLHAIEIAKAKVKIYSANCAVLICVI